VPFPFETLTAEALFNEHPLPSLLVNASDGTIIKANTAALHLLQVNNLIDLPSLFSDFASEHEKSIVLNCLLQAESRKKWKVEMTLITHLGHSIQVEIQGRFVGDYPDSYHYLVLIDQTGKYQQQEALTTIVQRYKDFMEQSSEGIFLHEFKDPIPLDLDEDLFLEQLMLGSEITDCNNAFARMYGFSSAQDMRGLKASQFVDFTDQANIEYLRAFKRNGFQLLDAESHEIDKEGQLKYFLNNLVGVVEKGKLKRVWGGQRDITEKKKIRKELHLYASLVEQTSDVLIGIDLEFKTISWNDAAGKVTGLSASQTIGKVIREYLDIQYVGYHYEEVRNIIRTRGEWHGEMYFIRPLDGEKVTLLSTYKLFRNETGQPAGFIIACKDITERKAAELKLQESERRFREVADSAPVMIWMLDEHNQTSYANKPFLEFTGLSWEVYLENKWSAIIYPEDTPIAIQKFNRHFVDRKPVTLIYRLRNREGAYRWVQDSSLPRYLGDGTFMGYIGSIVDIHDTKEKEQQLRYQATVLENVLDSIITTDLQSHVKTWNKMAEHFFGITEKEAVGCKMQELVTFEYMGFNKATVMMQLKLNGIWKGEVSYVNKWGEMCYFNHTLTYVYNEEGLRISIMSVSRDITERKQAEEKLKRSEQFYRSLISDSSDGMILTNTQGLIKFVSPSVKHSLGYNPNELLYKNAAHFVHPEDRLQAIHIFNQAVRPEKEFRFIVIRLLRKNGKWLWCMVRGHNLLDNPYVNSLVLYFHDDTLRKEATMALQESEQRFRKLVYDLKVGVMLQDAMGKIVMANKVILHTLQMTETQLQGKMIVDIVDDAVKEDGQPFLFEERPLNIVLHTRKPVQGTVMGIKNRESGDTIWMMMNVNPIFNDEGEIMHIITSFIDITERKKLEQQLWQEKVKHQRQLTQATIDGQEKERREIGKELHDNIGQQLTTIKLYLEMVRTNASSNTVHMINQALKNVSGLINEVRSISRALMPPTLSDLGLIDSINEFLDSMNRVQTFTATFTYHHVNEDNIPENQKLMLFRIIQEQFNNIIKHAKAKTVNVNLSQQTGALQLIISDDGVGFDLIQLNRGLGLTNIRNRAELFGGKVQITTAAGRGCRLVVIIPEEGNE
jgi:PAS domain S-box-containing protein